MDLISHTKQVLWDDWTTSPRVAVLVTLVFVCLATFYAPDNLNPPWIRHRFPLVGEELGSRKERIKVFVTPTGFQLFQRAYKRFKNGVFRITTDEGELVVLPNAALDDLRLLPDDHISRHEPMDIKNQQKHTGLKAADESLSAAIRGDLNRNLNLVSDTMVAEAQLSIEREMGGYLKEWTSMIPQKNMVRIVTIVSGAVFVGADLCQHPIYVDHVNRFARSLHPFARKLCHSPPLLRYVVRYFMPEYGQLMESRRLVREFLRPVVMERTRLLKEGGDLPEDLITWTLRKSINSDVPNDLETLTTLQFGMSVSAALPQVLMANACLYELAVLPEVVNEIRQEIRDAKAKFGALNNKALNELKLLDSVMRETMRLNPTNATRWARYARKPITLKDGTYIPAGTTFRILGGPLLFDPDLYPEPEKFDPYRFVKLRNGDVPDPIGYKNKDMYQFVSAAKENFHWGFDRHACPGRFFASICLKVVLAEVLTRYDVRMPGGAEEKHPYIERGEFRSIDQSRPLEFRSVGV